MAVFGGEWQHAARRCAVRFLLGLTTMLGVRTIVCMPSPVHMDIYQVHISALLPWLSICSALCNVLPERIRQLKLILLALSI